MGAKQQGGNGQSGVAGSADPRMLASRLACNCGLHARNVRFEAFQVPRSKTWRSCHKSQHAPKPDTQTPTNESHQQNTNNTTTSAPCAVEAKQLRVSAHESDHALNRQRQESEPRPDCYNETEHARHRVKCQHPKSGTCKILDTT